MAQTIYILTLTDENGGFTDYERRCPTDTEVTYCPDISTAEHIEREFFKEIAETEDCQSWLASHQRSNLTDESVEEYCDQNGFSSEIKEGFIVDKMRPSQRQQCISCGGEIRSVRVDARLCSQACRSREYRKRKKKAQVHAETSR